MKTTFRFGYFLMIFWVMGLSSGFAQILPPQKQWDKTFGGFELDRLHSMVNTTDGGYLLGGQSTSYPNGDKSGKRIGNGEYWILKVDKNGIKQWDKTFGGYGWDELMVILNTKDGGFY
jgi:hypothetical protein